MTDNPRVVYRALSPQEWMRLHGELPIRLQQLVVDDHVDLSALITPAVAALELLDWQVAANEGSFTPTDLATVDRLRHALRALKVAT